MPRGPRKTKPIPLDELAEVIDRLRGLSGVALTKAVRDEQLAALARASVAYAGDEGCWQAHQEGLSYKEIADRIGYADDGPVSRSISNVNKHRRGEL